jgi:hypothetical protein
MDMQHPAIGVPAAVTLGTLVADKVGSQPLAYFQARQGNGAIVHGDDGFQQSFCDVEGARTFIRINSAQEYQLSENTWKVPALLTGLHLEVCKP